MTTNKLLKISSDYNFRILFSYLDYNYIIKVIKYNKFLQNKVNIKIEAKCNYIIEEKIIDRENLQKIYDFNKNSMDISFYFFSDIYSIYSISFIINRSFVFYKLLTGLFLALFCRFICYFKGKNQSLIRFLMPFIISLLKKEFFYLKYLYAFLIRIFFLFIVQKFCLPKKIENESILNLKTKLIISIIIYCLTFIYDCFLIKITKENYHLTIYIFYIAYTFIFFIVVFLFYCYYFDFLKNRKFYITEYKNIKINDYLLQNFEKENNKEQYINSICKNFKIKRSFEEIELISKINKFRIQNKLEQLSVNVSIPDFLINKPSELILFPYKKLYKIFNGPKYIFKIIANDSNFLNNIEIKKFLLENNLNRINIIRQNDFIYISPIF